MHSAVILLFSRRSSIGTLQAAVRMYDSAAEAYPTLNDGDKNRKKHD